MIFEPVSPPLAVPDVSDLAHEVGLLLDGSLRSLRRALAELESDTPANAAEVRDRLRVAESSMVRITRLLDEAARSVDASCAVGPGTPFRSALGDLIATLAPIADAAGVYVEVQLDDVVAEWPVGPLGPVLHHAMRSAIEAAAHGVSSVRRVVVSLGRDRDVLRLHVVDSGPGLPPPGSAEPTPGGSLDRSRRIIDALGGRLRLMNIPFRDGAVFEVDVPLSRLEQA